MFSRVQNKLKRGFTTKRASEEKVDFLFRASEGRKGQNHRVYFAIVQACLRRQAQRVSLKRRSLPPRAFTLVETLVAISVLLLALAGPMSLAARALSSAHYAKDEITAFYLAQEGIEYVRAIRDKNYLTGLAWLNGIKNCKGVACTVDTRTFTHRLCSGTCPALQITPAGGIYNQSIGDFSPFTRSVTLIELNPNEVVVKVTMSWMSGRISRSFELKDHLLRSQ